MKNIILIFLSMFLLVACGNNASNESDKENPEPGDIFLTDTGSGDMVIDAYIEVESEFELTPGDGNELNISFEEPGNSEEYELSTYNLTNGAQYDAINFFINGEEVEATVLDE